MPRVGPHTIIAEGIARYATRYRVIAGIGRRQEEKGFPLDAPLEKMLAWQLTTKARLLKTAPTASAGSLAAAVPRFLATIASARTRAYHATNLAPWVALYGHLPRHEITSVLLRQTLARWQQEPRPAPADGRRRRGDPDAPYAANTLNHRLSSLRRLYTVLDADDEGAVNPCLRVEKLETPEPEPREIPAAVIEAFFATVPVYRYRHGLAPDAVAAVYQAAIAGANKSALAKQYGISETAVRKIIDRKGKSERATMAASRLRLEVKRRTGLPWKQIGAITRGHLRLSTDPATPLGGHLWVTPRRKGKKQKGRWLPLTREAVVAILQLLAHAPGPFSASSVYQFFRRHLATVIDAMTKAGTLPPMPPDLRPYDIRHSFLTQVQRAGRDRKATQGLGLHAHPSTTDRYIRGAEADGEEAALTALSRSAAPGPVGASQP